MRYILGQLCSARKYHWSVLKYSLKAENAIITQTMKKLEEPLNPRAIDVFGEKTTLRRTRVYLVMYSR